MNNFLNFNNEIINISNIKKISIQNKHLSILLDDGICYDYDIEESNIKTLISKLHDHFNTSNNITLDFDIN